VRVQPEEISFDPEIFGIEGHPEGHPEPTFKIDLKIMRRQ